MNSSNVLQVLSIGNYRNIVSPVTVPTVKVLDCCSRIEHLPLDQNSTWQVFPDQNSPYVLVKAEEAARESRSTKQDWYAEMRRKKDEEREAEERKLVGQLFHLQFSSV